jgi:hypothetical protein
VRAFVVLRYLLPLLALGVLWRLQPEAVSPILRGGFAINVGTADQPREFVVPTALLLIAPLALRFGLPLILKAALLLPFAATAMTHQVGRKATFDPARDLPNDSLAPGSPEEAAIDKAIAAALAARRTVSAQPPAFGRVERAVGAATAVSTPPVGRRDSAA